MKNRFTSVMLVSFLVIGGFIGFVNFESERAQGATYVSGPIGTDTVWYLLGTPYIVTGDVTVMSGVTLTINPGVQVKFDGNYGIYVDGTLMAVGTELLWIIITSNSTMPVLYWKSIQIETNGHAEIKYCEITYARDAISLYSSNNIVTNNILRYNTNGICLYSSSNNNIAYNEFFETGYGIWPQGSSNNNITNNNFSNLGGKWLGGGIRLSSSSNINITNNNFENNGIVIFGDTLEHFNSHIIPDNNLVNGKPLHYYKDCDNLYIDGIQLGELLLANCTNITITNMQINNTNVGIEAACSSDIQIVNNNFSANFLDGIYISHSSKVSIIGNNVSLNHQCGISIDSSSGNSITGNNASYNVHAGIKLLNSDGNNITGNTARENTQGIRHESSSCNTIENNTASNNGGRGIWLMYSIGNYLINNTFNSNGIAGIDLVLSSSNMIANNSCSNNDGDGIHLQDFSLDNSITGNTVSSNLEDGIDIYNFSNGTYITGNNVSNNNHNGIALIWRTSNNIVMGNAVYLNKWYGIDLYASSNNTISNNNVYSNDKGIDLQSLFYSSSYNNITGNNISNNRDGICLSQSSNSDILDNDISGNLKGINVSSSDNNNISCNNITDNGDGIYLSSSKNNNITANNISDNIKGINMSSSSNNNIITVNNISNNGNGIMIEYSGYNKIIGNTFLLNSWYGIDIGNEGNNTIYHNSFISNNGGGVQAYDDIGTNYWNDIYPSGGNYWDDWTTPDIKSGENQDQPGSDGFVDIPYYLDGGANARDRYPFAVPEILVLPPPTNLTTKVVNNNDNVELEWDSPVSPILDHYLIYRAGSAIEFDFTAPYNSSTTWSDPLYTTWIDPDPSVTSIDNDFYYIIRAANYDESVVSMTSNTAGVWTRSFQAGTSAFSLPLEPFEKKDAEFYCQDMNASYIKWMNSTTHKWMRHDRGSLENITFIEVGEGYEIGFDEQTRYTFCGIPGAMIVYNDDSGFSGFDPDSEAKNLSVYVDAEGNVTLIWEEPTNMGVGDWYEVYYSNTRDGFFGTPGIHYDLACPAVNFGTNTATITGLGANDPGTRLYFMVVPFNSLGIRGAGTYSIGIWTEEYLDQYDTIGIPLKLNYLQTVDWYCENIPETVGINYYDVNAQRWSWHSARMPEGAFDPLLVMTEGYQISTSSAAKFTFIGR